jgi:hypothetical protein
MPTISMFYGLIIRMYYFDTQRHKLPHIHVLYQGREAVFDIATGHLIEGKIPRTKARLIPAWIEIHQEELLADWQLAVAGEPLFRIEPLR